MENSTLLDDSLESKLMIQPLLQSLRPNGAIEIVVISAALILLLRGFVGSKSFPKLPHAGYRSVFEPAFWVRLRFIWSAQSILQDAYRKFKDQAFVIQVQGSDMLVLPRRCLEEIRSIPRKKLNGMEAQFANVMGHYTYLAPALKSDIHNVVITKYLTPNLSRFMVSVQDELDFALEKEMPQCDDWTVVDIQQVLLHLVARTAARVMVGRPACRDDEWLSISRNYTVNLWATAFIIHLFPSFMHPVVARLLPTRYKLFKDLKRAERILEPVVESHRERRTTGTATATEDQFTLLSTMMDEAVSTEKGLEELAFRQLFIGMAAIHTNSYTLSNVVFDLCAHPEYVEPLTEEVHETMQNEPDWVQHLLPKLEKMDSFITESMRGHAPMLLNPSRVAKEPITLKDGTHIPKGMQITFPSVPIMHDPEIYPDPTAFDGFRSYRKRQENSGNGPPSTTIRNAFVTPSTEWLTFGYGNQACPGRFFAACMTKLILAYLLRDYEMKLPQGKERPDGVFVEFFRVFNPRAKIVMRKKKAIGREIGI